MLCLILLASVRNLSSVPLGIGPVWYTGGYTLLTLSFYAFFKNKQAFRWIYLTPVLYILWAFVGIFRGQFEITSGFVMNQYFHGILYVLVPMCIFLFAFPDTLIRSLQIFNIFALIYSFSSYGWNMQLGAYYFALTPFAYFYFCFFPKIPKFWKIATIIAVVLIVADRTNGSGNIKLIMTVCVLLLFLLPSKITYFTASFMHWLIYIIPLVFLYLGATGEYNIFKDGFVGANTITTVGVNGIERQEKLGHTDTRTFIYEEIIGSAVINDYYIAGRTPARGYYSPHFEKDEENIAGKIRGERFSSEVALLNTFHWLGLIGLVLISLVYLQGSCLALYRSNNKYLKCLSIAVAFQWMWSWVENDNRFHMLDLIIYIMLAICYSPYFRKMSDLEFEMVFKSIFRDPRKALHDYNKYKLLKSYLMKNESR